MGGTSLFKRKLDPKSAPAFNVYILGMAIAILLKFEAREQVPLT